jgi:lysozyme family protein
VSVMANFDVAFEVAFGHEGGYTDDPNDDGNWTGGKKGVGELKGTKFGISAKTYPDLDIKNLTVPEAKSVYLFDWWEPNRYGEIAAQVIATKVFDLAINMGGPDHLRKPPDASRANIILQVAAWKLGQKIVVDGEIGSKTIAAVNVVYPADLLTNIREGAVQYYTDLAARRPEKKCYLNNWLRRARS